MIFVIERVPKDGVFRLELFQEEKKKTNGTQRKRRGQLLLFRMVGIPHYGKKMIRTYGRKENQKEKSRGKYYTPSPLYSLCPNKR